MKPDTQFNAHRMVLAGFLAGCLSAAALRPALAVPVYSYSVPSATPGQVLDSPLPLSVSTAGEGYAAAGAAGYGYASSSTSIASPNAPWGVQSMSMFMLDDIVISGPPGSTPADIVSYSVNLVISGSIGAARTGVRFAVATVTVEAYSNSSLGGFSNVTFGTMTAFDDGVGTTGSGVSATGALAGFSGITPAVSPPHVARAGDTVRIGFELNTQSLSTYPSGPFDVGWGVVAFSDFHVRLPTSGPVFNLPEGWTANSLGGQIVDNHFVPEPSGVALAAVGAIGLLALGKRSLRRSQPGRCGKVS